VIRLGWVVLLALQCSGAYCADKKSPDYLRQKHHRVEQLASAKEVGALFPELLESARKCYVGGGMPMTLSAAGSLIEASTGYRKVGGLQAIDGKSAYIRVDAREGFVLRPMIQIDIAAQPAGTDVTVFAASDNELQNNAFGNVRDWLDGNLVSCKLDRFQSAPAR
jgi:hypothetical protein